MTNLKQLAALSGENGGRLPLRQQQTEAVNPLTMLYARHSLRVIGMSMRGI